MARSFQRTNIFPDLTVEQQLRIASWAVEDAEIDEVMSEFGLVAFCRHGGGGNQLRRSAPARSGARAGWASSVLLLDEPAAGLTMEESLGLAAITRRNPANRWNVTALLVEHDMQVCVFDLRPHQRAAPRQIVERGHLRRSESEPDCHRSLSRNGGVMSLLAFHDIACSVRKCPHS